MLSELINWKAAAEILLLGVAYFFILSSIRGTRGAAILKGIIFVFVVAFIGAVWAADRLGLERIKEMLKLLLGGSFVALVVIFTPELRRGLLRLAQSPLLSPLLHGQSFQIIDDLVATVMKFARSRTGALIAIERESGLGEYVEKGAKVGAVLTPELLETIFYPGSALHDGAVIIQHDSIAAAGCLLPLTEDADLSKSLGTRHRAAIGLSEETDAIVIVVSEESGKVSVCVGGKMTTDLDAASLDKLLRELYVRADRTTLTRRHAPAPDVPPPKAGSNGDNGDGKDQKEPDRAAKHRGP